MVRANCGCHRNGFLHRYVIIGGILTLDPPVTTRPFKVRAVGRLMAQLSFQYEGELAEYVSLLENTIEKSGFSDKCDGFVARRRG